MHLKPDFLLYSIRPEWAILKGEKVFSVGHRAAFNTSKSTRAEGEREEEACMCFQTNPVLLCKVLKSTLHSAVQTGSVESLELCLSWSGCRHPLNKQVSAGEKNVEASVCVRVCSYLRVCVYTQPWLWPCEKRLLPLLSTVCEQVSKPPFLVPPVGTNTVTKPLKHTYSHTHTDTNPIWFSGEYLCLLMVRFQ